MLVSFGLLVLFAITQTARMLTTVNIEHDRGVPKAWASLLSSSNPETITVPVTYYDQKFDPCKDAASTRQFEYIACGINDGKMTQGLVQQKLGSDGKPRPVYATAAAAAVAHTTNKGIWGDNFTRWFNEVEGKSQRVDGDITFKREGDANIYTFGGPNFFPLDGNEFSDGDVSANGHNFHFTAMTSFPFEVQANGDERWEFRGDDDVWVFINGELVLDIGGLHTAIDGYFVINKDGTVTATVDGKSKTTNLGLKEGDIAQLSFFYAERSTTEANCKITIKNMIWPIRASADIEAETVDNKLIRYTSSITNRDPANSLDVTHIATFLNDGEEFNEDGYGFLPLSDGSLFFTLTPDDESSWKAVKISAPHSSDIGSQLEAAIKLAPNGKTGDTAYFAFYVAPDKTSGSYFNTITYKTRLNGAESLARAADYSGFENITPIPPTEKPKPGEDLGDPDDGYLDPLGESDEIYPGDGSLSHDGDLFAPDTGVADVASIILSQWFLLGTLLVFGVSFAVYYPNRSF